MSYDIARIVSRETIARLELYRDLLLQWQQRINLIADIDNIWERHFIDSAQLFSLFHDRNASVLDMGSGAGFPGLVLSIMGMEQMHLAESDRRKVEFLKEAKRITGASAQIHHTRVEALEAPKFDVVTSRALANIHTLLTLATPHMKENAFCIFPKGKNWSIEVEEARKHWQCDVEQLPSITHAEGAILLIRNIHKVT
jgi:16S rRNA (guanine527-N7)-methyltransferase